MKALNTVTLTLGAALLGASLASQAAGNPFAAQELSSGYNLAAHEKGHEGSCGEAKCGAEKATKKAEGSCGGDKMKEGSGGGEKAKQEGSCGADKMGKQAEGTCGAGKMDKQGQ